MCGEAEKEHLLRRVATTLSSRQEVQQRQTYVIIKSEKQHLSPSAQNKRAPPHFLCKSKKTKDCKISIHQTQAKRIHASRLWALKKKKIPSDIWVSACEKAAPFFLCWLPGIHMRKKKKKKYRIQNSMVHCASCLIYSSNQTDRIRRKKESLNYMQK